MDASAGTPPISLGNAALEQLARSLPVPGYDRGPLTGGLVHIGVGGFNRSHLAVYLDDLLRQAGDPRWSEWGVGLMPADRQLHADLAAQDYLYGLLLMDSGEESYRIIGSLCHHVYAPEATEAVLARLSSPGCAIVSLTVTEGGYFIEDATGRFAADHAGLRHDLEHPDQPRTWLGYVAEGCRRRMQQGAAPFTLLSCDNLQGNGDTARTALLAFADMRGAELRRWIEANVAFPNSMVDRITPRTTAEQRAAIEEKFGVLDRAPVVSEPFRQWVLEDHFAAGRPAWERAGAQMTADVVPYERTKMRLLNGGHSALGYPADLLGIATIAEAANDPLLRRLLIAFMAEVRPTLHNLPGIDLEDYSAAVVKRFSNVAIRDQVARICSDGCAKIAKFIVPTLNDLLAAGANPQILPWVIASWLHYLRGSDEHGRALTIADPGLPGLQPFLDAGGGNAALALAVPPIFGDLASAHPALVDKVQAALDHLRQHGVRWALTHILQQTEAA